ncbi:MAG: DJ-1/PfpI/YhbO family deglycase/protease [Micavibrio sp.]|nr:DJ-1/PfpI/YhbO family deglycase/protease [Micavibrio sp.]
MTTKIPDDIFAPTHSEGPGAKSALIITADKVEDLEFFYPFYRLTEEGYRVDIATPDGKFKGKNGYGLQTTLKLTDVKADDYDLLVLPGGKAPAELVKNDNALIFVKAFAATGKTIAAICHGPQILAAAGLIDGKLISGWPEIEEELTEAGADFVSDKALVDGQFITARWPGDLPAWMNAVLAQMDGAGVAAGAGKGKPAPQLSV